LKTSADTGDLSAGYGGDLDCAYASVRAANGWQVVTDMRPLCNRSGPRWTASPVPGERTALRRGGTVRAAPRAVALAGDESDEGAIFARWFVL